MGPETFEFVDLLAASGQTLWQILPLNPTSFKSGNSPYSATSVFAGNPLLISPELLRDYSFLTDSELKPYRIVSRNRVNYAGVISSRHELFSLAFSRFGTCPSKERELFEKFVYENSFWLDDYTLFTALSEHFNNSPWNRWPEALRNRDKKQMNRYKKKLHEKILFESFLQFFFYKQWFLLKQYCTERGIKVIGDLPFYVNYNSSDVWGNQDIFKLGEDCLPTRLAGVPPDYFSEDGQLWGNPVYCWERLRRDDYSWWVKRIEHNLGLFDLVRLDHFRGFSACWEVPPCSDNAIYGEWVKAPALDFFAVVKRRFPDIPVIAEDLGEITPDVENIIEHFNFPGMRVLLFAFGDDISSNPHAPHNYTENCAVYTGTHDNNTVLGWYRDEADKDIVNRLSKYVGEPVTLKNINTVMIRLAMMSVARMAIIPAQDILSLDENNRMNVPSTSEGNWGWRVHPEQLSSSLFRDLGEISLISGRC